MKVEHEPGETLQPAAPREVTAKAPTLTGWPTGRRPGFSAVRAGSPHGMADRKEAGILSSVGWKPSRGNLPPVFVLNFYSPIFSDQLKRGRKTATIRLGDKSSKYRKGEVVLVTVGFQHSPRERIFEAVIDSVEVKPAGELSPRDIEHDNPEFRRLDETTHFLEQIYGREVTEKDAVTVVRFSQISDRPHDISERMRPHAPTQN